MAIQREEHPFVRCTENIAMLYFLHQVPARPSSNPEPKDVSVETEYTLPFKEERNLSGILAFLAQTEDDPDHIPAVCLQETPEERSLNILLAVNGRGHPDHTSQGLSKTEVGFKKIASVLEHVDDSSQTTEQKIFGIIVDMCQSRILTRLRFTRKRRDSADTQRMTITDGLRMAIGYFGKATVRKPENSALFLDRAGKVLELAKSWSQPELWPKTQMLQWLGQLVEGVNSLRQIKKFEEIMLDFIPNKEMGESQRLHLLNMVLKVARYREAARWILRIAIQFPLVRHMRVIAVELPYEAFERLPPDREYRSSIQSTISRLQGLESTHRDIGEMCDLLGVSTEEANIQYTEQVNKTLQKSKIHAEIQLFYHCQTRLRGQKLLPRVIRSSKSACWLCNAFLLLHSNIYTPRCHGRLYPGWRLPALHGDWCGDIEARFNQCLERQLADSIRNLHSRRKRCSNCPPMESDLSIITWMSSGWSNTKPTITIAENENVREEAPALILDAPMVLESDPRPDPEIAVAEASIEFSEILYNRSSTELLSTVTIGDPKHNSTPSGSRLHGTHHILTAQTAEPSPKETHPVAEVASTEVWVEDSESLDSSVSMGSASAAAASRESHSFTTSESILQEAQDNIRSNSVVQGKASKLYDLGPMQFQIEYASNPGQKLQGDGPSRQLSCTMEWLSPEHVESLRLEGRDLIDAESLTEQEISRSLDMSNSIYLSVKEAVLRVMMQPVS